MTTILIFVAIVIIVLIVVNSNQKKQVQNRNTREVEMEIAKVCNSKLKTTFMVTDWDHLDDRASEIQRNVQIGEKLELALDENNKYDSLAIQVLKNGTQIGWYGMGEPKKKEVFILLGSGKEVKAEVVETFPMHIQVTYNPFYLL